MNYILEITKKGNNNQFSKSCNLLTKILNITFIRSKNGFWVSTQTSNKKVQLFFADVQDEEEFEYEVEYRMKYEFKPKGCNWEIIGNRNCKYNKSQLWSYVFIKDQSLVPTKTIDKIIKRGNLNISNYMTINENYKSVEIFYRGKMQDIFNLVSHVARMKAFNLEFKFSDSNLRHLYTARVEKKCNNYLLLMGDNTGLYTADFKVNSLNEYLNEINSRF